MYVGIRSEIASFPVSVLDADPKKTIELADLGTRLYALQQGRARAPDQLGLHRVRRRPALARVRRSRTRRCHPVAVSERATEMTQTTAPKSGPPSNAAATTPAHLRLRPDVHPAVGTVPHRQRALRARPRSRGPKGNCCASSTSTRCAKAGMPWSISTSRIFWLRMACSRPRVTRAHTSRSSTRSRRASSSGSSGTSADDSGGVATRS